MPKAKKENYDYALLSQVFEHLEKPKEYIDKIKKVAKKVIVVLPNGEVGKVIVDNDKDYVKEMEETDYHYATYTAEDIKEMFPKAEFIQTDNNNLFFIV